MAKRKTSVDKTYLAIYAAIRRVPRGKVCSYGGIAQLANLPRRVRLVGTVLKNAPSSLRLRWYRIVTASGRLAFPAGSEPYRKQRSQLEREGVEFQSGRIDMHRFGWPARDVELDELLWSPQLSPRRSR